MTQYGPVAGACWCQLTQVMGTVARDNGRSLTDRWLRVLWLAEIREAGGGACGSSNQHASTHCRAQRGRQGDMYLDCVHSAGIS